jgi:hypothetical protein
MPGELHTALLDAGGFVSTDPTGVDHAGAGVINITKADGTVASLLSWNPATGDATHYSPAGSNALGGTRRQLFDRELYVDTTGAGAYVNVRDWGSILNKPATFPPSAHSHTYAALKAADGAWPTSLAGYGIADSVALYSAANTFTQNQTIRTGAVSILIIDTAAPGSSADATYTRYSRGGNAKWSTGLNRSGVNADTYDVYDEVNGATRWRILTTGAVLPNGGTLLPGTDAASDFGSVSFRWRNGTLSGTFTAGTLVATGGAGGASGLSVTQSNAYSLVNGGTTENHSFGLAINAGTSASDMALLVRNGSGGTTFFSVRGDGAISIGGAVTPITDAAFDFGSTTFRYRDGNFSGRVKGGTLDASVFQLADWNFAKWSGGTITIGGDAGQFNAVAIQSAGTVVGTFTSTGLSVAGALVVSNGATVTVTGSGTALAAIGRPATNDSYLTFWNNAANTQLGYVGSDGNNLYFARGTTPVVQMTTSAWFPTTDSATDSGTSSSRWRDGYFSRNLKLGNVTTAQLDNTGAQVVINGGSSYAITVGSFSDGKISDFNITGETCRFTVSNNTVVIENAASCPDFIVAAGTTANKINISVSAGVLTVWNKFGAGTNGTFGFTTTKRA